MSPCTKSRWVSATSSRASHYIEYSHPLVHARCRTDESARQAPPVQRCLQKFCVVDISVLAPNRPQPLMSKGRAGRSESCMRLRVVRDISANCTWTDAALDRCISPGILDLIAPVTAVDSDALCCESPVRLRRSTSCSVCLIRLNSPATRTATAHIMRRHSEQANSLPALFLEVSGVEVSGTPSLQT